MRVLSSSSSDDGEDGDDNDDSDGGDGGGGGDDNNEGNNSADGGTYGVTYSLEGHMQMLSLASGQHYGVTYVHDYISQLDRSTSTSIGLSTYRRDDYDDDFMSHRNSM